MGKNPFGRAIPAVLSAALALSLSPAALAAEPDTAGQDAAANARLSAQLDLLWEMEQLTLQNLL